MRPGYKVAKSYEFGFESDPSRAKETTETATLEIEGRKRQ